MLGNSVSHHMNQFHEGTARERKDLLFFGSWMCFSLVETARKEALAFMSFGKTTRTTDISTTPPPEVWTLQVFRLGVSPKSRESLGRRGAQGNLAQHPHNVVTSWPRSRRQSCCSQRLGGCMSLVSSGRWSSSFSDFCRCVPTRKVGSARVCAQAGHWNSLPSPPLPPTSPKKQGCQFRYGKSILPASTLLSVMPPYTWWVA